MVQLAFEMEEVKKLVNLTGEGKNFHGEPYSGKKGTEPVLWIVKDSGVYLMSNRIFKKLPKDKSHCLYAKGYNPELDKDYWEKGQKLGGDDFVEICMRLTPANLDWFKTTKHTKFFISVTSSQFKISSI